MTTTWTAIPKPTSGGMITIPNGTPIGLLMALTYPNSSSVMSSGWTNINKASGTVYTNIPKAT